MEDLKDKVLITKSDYDDLLAYKRLIEEKGVSIIAEMCPHDGDFYNAKVFTDDEAVRRLAIAIDSLEEEWLNEEEKIKALSIWEFMKFRNDIFYEL